MKKRKKKQLHANTPQEQLVKTNNPSQITKNSYWYEKQPQPFDESLLTHLKNLWIEGRWDALVKIDETIIDQHPDRAKIAMVISSAFHNLGENEMSYQFARKAIEWGCDKKTISKLLLSGVSNTLGRIYAVNKDEVKSMNYFKVSTSMIASSTTNVVSLRAKNELKRLGITDLFKSISINAISPYRMSRSEIEKFTQDCLENSDVHSRVDYLLDKFLISKLDRFNFFVSLSDGFKKKKDNITALHFLSMAEKNLTSMDEKLELSKKFLNLGRYEEATDLLVNYSLGLKDLSDKEKNVLLQSYEKVQKEVRAIAEHGHELLLSYLKLNLINLREEFIGRKPVLIEIGTTREDISGQGSTAKIADFCKKEGIHFITVDMDPHNTQMANDLFAKMGVGFEAINKKGEDFLREYSGNMDFVFLDAYDFDHGKHSELRQSRYIKYLGNPIDEKLCHLMHLDCAESIVKKMSKHGVVCIDDTWLVNDEWCAKGTLAVPYLLKNNFELVEARNKSALLLPKR